MGTRLLLAGWLTLAAAGCGGGGDRAAAPTPTPTSTPEEAAAAVVPTDTAAIERLLFDRASRLEDGRGLATTSAGPQRKRDRQAARRARRIALERVRLGLGDFTKSGNRAVAEVALSYRVRGMSRPFRTWRKVTVRHARGTWRVTKDRPMREALPWEVSPFRAYRSRHVVLLAAPGVDAAPLRRGLEAAYRDIRRDLPRRDLPRSVLAIAARDRGQARRLVGRVARGVVAIANVSVRWGLPPALKVERVLAQRMVVIDSAWRRLDGVSRQSVLVHEMTHTALDPDTSGRMPAWLAEGVAMRVANDDRRTEQRARAAGLAPAMRLARISKPRSIFGLNGREQGAAYAAASAAAYTITDRRGTRGLFRLYDAFNDEDIPGRPSAKTTDRVMRKAIGLSLAELQSAID